MQDIEKNISRKEKLVTAGKKLFAAKGYPGTSVRDIAKAAGVNVSMVSYYFGGKEQLYTHIVEGFADEIRSLFTPETIAELNPHEKILYYARSVMTMHRENPQLARILHHEMTAPTPVLDGLQKNLFPHIFGFLYKTFEEGIRSGIFRADLDPAAMSYSLASLVNFYHFQKSLVHRMNPAFHREGAEIVERALDIFFDGVNAPAKEDGNLED